MPKITAWAKVWNSKIKIKKLMNEWINKAYYGEGYLVCNSLQRILIIWIGFYIMH